MTPRDVETLDFLEALAEDPSVSKTFSRQAVILAINTAAENHRGRVSAAWVRPHLPAWVNPSQVGARDLRTVQAGPPVEDHGDL